MEHTTKLPTHIAQSPTVDIFNSHLAQDFVNTNLFQINLFVFILKIKDIKKKLYKNGNIIILTHRFQLRFIKILQILVFAK